MLRTSLVFFMFFAALPFAFVYSWVAPLLYVAMSVMNPHKLTYGAAVTFPFAQIAALLSLFLLVVSKQRRNLPNHPLIYLMISLYLWMGLTSLVSINPVERVWEQWVAVSKTYLMVIVVALMIYERKSIQIFVMILAGSLAFYGLKGGIFTIITGGSERVWGATDSVIYGNNEIGLALVTILPIMAHYYGQSRSLLTKMGIAFVALMSFVAVLGTQSRGAAVALVAMTFFLGAKSKRPLFTTGGLVALCVVAFVLMPDSWTDRMYTMRNHEADSSAMSRISTWGMILNLAADRPFVGSGFALDNVGIYLKYHASFQIGDVPYAAHSIYFQALGEHGYVGLLLYLGVLGATWHAFGSLSKRFKTIPGEEWASSLCRMVQVGLLGFYSGGAFLGLMHWDFPFYLVGLCIIMIRYARQFESEEVPGSRQEAPIGLRYSRNSGYT
jgi:putative inorganic carbon (hco3(-)) transporter